MEKNRIQIIDNRTGATLDLCAGRNAFFIRAIERGESADLALSKKQAKELKKFLDAFLGEPNVIG